MSQGKSKVKPIPDGMNSIIPQLTVKGADAAIAFYKKALGAQELHRSQTPDGKKVMHATLKIGDSILFLADEFPEMGGGKSPLGLGGSPVTLHMYVEDVDKLFNQVVAAGAQVRMPPTNMCWGSRYSQVTDPFGHVWALATHVEDVSPEEAAARAKEMFSKPPAGKT